MEKLIARILNGVEQDPNGGCLLYSKTIDQYGYGRISSGTFKLGTYKNHLVHRLMYQHATGTDPVGRVVMHKCDVRACCNPDHLSLGTPADNIADMHAKGRYRCLVGEKAPNAKLTRDQAVEVLRLVRSGVSNTEVGKMFGVSNMCVSDIKRGARWKEIHA